MACFAAALGGKPHQCTNARAGHQCPGKHTGSHSIIFNYTYINYTYINYTYINYTHYYIRNNTHNNTHLNNKAQHFFHRHGHAHGKHCSYQRATRGNQHITGPGKGAGHSAPEARHPADSHARNCPRRQ
ncbi:hypothetical protein L1F30_05220 [Simiduia sp. 21SJ11W-1]|uniref:hypothetical protein n=1 Tax=Simiduia sp. 21SJ11W-1 TaxID=2909669 RepID=UPI00209F1110|nr:hypothetical protein [Simiduia sp. 21SJ11W-1]UTA48947.1 hypothetical protein L1F30_05220 [Simiduia sp. 21SJ11W-1]